MATKMFVILTILCIFNAALVKGFDKAAALSIFMAAMEDCKTEVGAKDADIEDMVGKKPSSSMEGKCLRACLMKKFEMMDNNGKFVKAVSLAHAEAYIDGAEDKMKGVREMMDICDSMEVSSDHCEAAEQYCKCFKEQADAHGLNGEFNF